MTGPALRLGKDLSRRVRTGHPWIYRDALDAPSRARLAGIPPGTAAHVEDPAGAPLAWGWVDPEGPIAVRVLGLAGEDDPNDPAAGTGWLRPRLEAALALRRAAAIDSDALRLLNGEGDHLPGLVIDLYRAVAVVRFDGPAAAAFWRPLAPMVIEACAAAGHAIETIWLRGGRGEVGEPLSGSPPPELVIREGEARFLVDVVHGQKTGFFLDQRANRRFLAGHVAGADVLNLFAYTGGFSTWAALGGARRVTSVDRAAPAIEAARKSFALSGCAGTPHELHAVDAFAFLAEARRTGRRWDVVVCDPPSFAPSARAVAGALPAYRRLNAAATAVTAPGGLLVTASCSSHVTLAAFLEAVGAGVCDGAGGEPWRARTFAIRGADVDHPAPPGFPEGRYLKLVALVTPSS